MTEATGLYLTAAALVLAACLILAWFACRMAGFNQDNDNG